MSFRDATAVVAEGPGRFTWDVPDGWRQGRGAFGGLVLGALCRAMEACEPDPERRVRSISGDLCAPMVPGPTAIAATVLRRGRGTTYLEARAERDGELIARASALLAGARAPSAAVVDAPPPALPPPADLPVAPIGEPPTPGFARNFRYRTAGPWPFAGAKEATCAGWIEPREPLATIDAAALIGLLDAWWPCALVVEPAPRPMATVAFTAELLADPATLDPSAPFAYAAHLAGAADGFSVELRHLWQHGRLVGLNQQTFCAI